MKSVSEKLGKIIDIARLDQVQARTVPERRYAELVEHRAIQASTYLGSGDMNETQAWSFFMTGRI